MSCKCETPVFRSLSPVEKKKRKKERQSQENIGVKEPSQTGVTLISSMVDWKTV